MVVSPQNIDNSMLAKLSEINLKHLYIVQNRNTLKAVLPCQAFAWLAFRSSRKNKTQVHLIVDVSSVCDCDLVIQPMAPTVSVTCSMKNIMVNRTATKMLELKLISRFPGGYWQLQRDVIDFLEQKSPEYHELTLILSEK